MRARSAAYFQETTEIDANSHAQVRAEFTIFSTKRWRQRADRWTVARSN